MGCRVVLAGLLGAVLAAPAPAQPTAWTRPGTEGRYPAAQYVVATASAPLSGRSLPDAQADADARALLALVQQLEVRVEGSSTSTVREQGTDGRSTMQQSFDQTAALRTDLTVAGAVIAERQVDRSAGLAWSLAVLDRDATVTRLDATLAEADRVRAAALDRLAGAPPITWTSFADAVEAALAADATIVRQSAIRRAVHPEGKSGPVAGNVAALRLAEVWRGVRLSVVSGLEQPALEGIAPKAPIVAEFGIVGAHGLTPISGAAVEWAADGLGISLDRPTPTDDAGRTMVRIESVDDGAAFPLRLTARVDWWRALVRAAKTPEAWRAFAPAAPLTAAAELPRRAVVGDARLVVTARSLPADVVSAARRHLDSLGFRTVAALGPAMDSDEGWWRRHRAAAPRAVHLEVQETALPDSPLGRGVRLQLTARVAATDATDDAVVTVTAQGVGPTAADARRRAVGRAVVDLAAQLVRAFAS